MCNKHIFNMNNSVNSVHNNCLEGTTQHRTANLCSFKKKIGEPAGTNISRIITPNIQTVYFPASPLAANSPHP